jgi:hypothetical protein
LLFQSWQEKIHKTKNPTLVTMLLVCTFPSIMTHAYEIPLPNPLRIQMETKLKTKAGETATALVAANVLLRTYPAALLGRAVRISLRGALALCHEGLQQRCSAALLKPLVAKREGSWQRDP